jgi:hypothetical protein
MNMRTLFRLGALATLTTALLLLMGNLMYFAGLADSPGFVWVSIIQAMVQVFVITAVYAAQSRRGGAIALLGYTILMVGLLFYLVYSEGRLALAVGFISQAQADQLPQSPALALLEPLATWATALGTLLFGIGTFRAGVFPRWAGLMLMVVGVTTLTEIRAIEYLWTALSVIAWAWIGWSLWLSQASPAEGSAAVVA